MRLKLAVLALAALGGVALTSTASSAMPNGIPNGNGIVGQNSNLQQTRYVSDQRRMTGRSGPRWRAAHVGGPRWRGAHAWGPRRVWRPGWRSAYAWGSPAPMWRPGPVWGASPGWE
jgi:hypothetical protein